MESRLEMIGGYIPSDHGRVLLTSCVDVKISHVAIPGRGFGFVAQSNVLAGQRLIMSPAEHRVEIPEDSPQMSTDPDCKQMVANPAIASWRQRQLRLQQDFATLKALASNIGDPISPKVYWAALLSLGDDEGPVDNRWPSVDSFTQSRLLLLFQPSHVYAHKPGHEFGSLIPKLCECFDLRVDPAKLLKLTKVWRYNSFISCSRNGKMVSTIDIAVALANHSCDPNCFVRRSDDFHSEVIAGPHGVKKHEEITISYVSDYDDSLIKPTKVRRQLLAMNWLFFCTCRKCAEIPIPNCPICPQKEMQVVLSRLEDVSSRRMCHGCQKMDLHVSQGYFFHCAMCGSSLCGWPLEDSEWQQEPRSEHRDVVGNPTSTERHFKRQRL